MTDIKTYNPRITKHETPDVEDIGSKPIMHNINKIILNDLCKFRQVVSLHVESKVGNTCSRYIIQKSIN